MSGTPSGAGGGRARSATFADYLSDNGLTLDGVTTDRNGTIRPEDAGDDAAVTGGVTTEPGTSPAGLPLVAIGPDGDFVPGELIGEGGMGRVVAARQAALGRDVAVKSLRPGRGTRARADLLHEARITGRLEHPNVVPVYLLGKDAEGKALFVMRRIGGHPWDALLASASASDGSAHAAIVGTDPLGFHIGVLAQVCQAVRFAHERGIVHRDLKPENVMIGDYGEVYVVDWGIAVALEPSDPPLPLARDIAGVAGSPAYMAPEMAMGDGARIGPWTDVYLLGAILHQVLTGEVRHRGDTLKDTLAHAYESRPVAYPPGCPGPLAALANAATSLDIAARPTADAFRAALVAWQQARPGLALLAEANARVVRAHERMASGGDALAIAAEARVLLQQARTLLPTEPAVEQALDGLVRRVIEHALGTGAVDVAAAWLPDLPAPDAALAARVDAARAAKAADLAALVRAADVTIGARERKWIMVGEATVFLVSGALAQALGLSAGYWVAIVLEAFMCTIATGAGVYLFSRPDHQSPTTRGLFYNLVFTVFVIGWCYAVPWLLGWPFAHAQAVCLLASAAILGTIATLVEPMAVVGALFIAAGALGVAWFPGALWLVTGLSTGLGFYAMAVTWWVQERRTASKAR